ncbi:helicase associated domain-containing protein [Streptomyces sp. NPDC096205]|uniref:helicase associated domain-containing protein n=1 Tax=Streptomyces sp. NPDC096205 TaxID=3366081 RepID=UPI003827FADE
MGANPYSTGGGRVWPAHRQRHYAALRELVADEESQADVLSGFTVHGMDIGSGWAARQRQPEVWQALHDGQRERLEQLGIPPLGPAPEPTTASMSAFERGVAALGGVQGPRGLCEGPPGPT